MIIIIHRDVHIMLSKVYLKNVGALRTYYNKRTLYIFTQLIYFYKENVGMFFINLELRKLC